MAASLSMRPQRKLLAFVLQRRGVFTPSCVHQHYSTPAVRDQQLPSENTANEIVIPLKKKRDSLSVLRALASTVTRDPSSPHYKYIDDPYLIPSSSLSKRSYALAKESGKKAAKYILENHSQFFNKNPSLPPVAAFMPSPKTYIYTEACEAALLERIEKRRVTDAVEVYKKIKQGKQNLSEGACLKLLELLCVFNNEDPPKSLDQEEFFFRRDLGYENKRPSKTWKDNGMAERLFDEMKEKPAEAYQHLIRGMAKHLQTEKAFQLYDEMVEKKMKVSLSTYNELIRAAVFHKDTYETKWHQIQTLLMDMQLSEVRPNLDTFNAVLFCLSRISMFRQASTLALQTLVEMKTLDIKPSLATWSLILVIFYPNENSDSNMLYKIMDEIEGQKFKLQSIEDGEFFLSAMKRCCNNLHDLELAYRIDKLLNTDNNIQLMVDSRLENVYYTFFLQLVCTFESLEKIMEVYQRVTPHIWTPNYSVLGELLKAMELQDGFKYLPLIWTDLLLFDFLRREELLEHLLYLMAKQKQESELQSQYVHITRQLAERWKEEQEEGRQSVLSTGSMLGYLIVIAENGDDHNLAWTVFDIYRNNKVKFTGLLSEASMKQLVDGCLKSGEGEQVLAVLSFMDSMEMTGVRTIVQTVLKSENIALSQVQRDILSAM